MRSLRLILVLTLLAATAPAQFAPKSKAKAGKTVPVAVTKETVLRPPPGAKVAIVVFEDHQCPDCGRAHPLVKEVARQQRVPVVHRDFPLPGHNWAYEAAVTRRFFDSKSKELGEAYRDYLYKNQAAITSTNLAEFTRKFAQERGVAMPFLLDPGKKLAAKVDADVAIGKKIGIQHTPTIWVVGANTGAAEPFIEVVDRSQLSRHIEEMKQQAGSR